ncbi:TetR/AcrR family transcriptional regulator [Aurantiacibacter suaedae]|uniref:TetR/AcrR family transcriptional regulator n=1 Tax=Aurantiacibacter suaedae TaxID=2545755 RepID=UPI0010F77DDB|nr:TetR/AcrR family transcriptional regulator [Aurantiacibacter suaedae]
MSTASGIIEARSSGRGRVGRKISLEKRAEIGRQKRARTREKMLEAAFLLLGREDGRSTRIEEICKEAKVARGTFYNYFSSVEELLSALTFDISHDFNLAVRAIIRTVPAGALRCSFALRYYMHRTREDPAWGWAMVNLSAGGPIFGEETARYGIEAVIEGMVTEQFHAGSAQLAYDLMHGATLAGMITQLRSEQPDDYPEQMVTLIMRGLGVSESLVERCIRTELPEPESFVRQFGQSPAKGFGDMAGLTLLGEGLPPRFGEDSPD